MTLWIGSATGAEVRPAGTDGVDRLVAAWRGQFGPQIRDGDETAFRQYAVICWRVLEDPRKNHHLLGEPAAAGAVDQAVRAAERLSSSPMLVQAVLRSRDAEARFCAAEAFSRLADGMSDVDRDAMRRALAAFRESGPSRDDLAPGTIVVETGEGNAINKQTATIVRKLVGGN